MLEFSSLPGEKYYYSISVFTRISTQILFSQRKRLCNTVPTQPLHLNTIKGIFENIFGWPKLGSGQFLGENVDAQHSFFLLQIFTPFLDYIYI